MGTIQAQINADIKAAMLAKEKTKLEALRAVKSALLLLATEKGGDGVVSDDDALKAIQKLVKQRKDAAAIFQEQNRADLADDELNQASVIEVYLPQQLSESEIEAEVQKIIESVGASGPSDLGKVMGPAMKALGGKADGKLVNQAVKKLLS